MGVFPSVLKLIRERSGLTQQQMAEKLGVSRSAVGMYENGEREPNFETLELIADTFNVDMNYLLCKKPMTEVFPNAYCFDDDARDMAQFLYENPDYKVLFDARGVHMCLGKNIRFLRTKYGLSQDCIADELGYKSFTTIQKWESGVSEPPLKALKKLADIFKVNMNDLVTKKLYLGESSTNDTYYLNDDVRKIFPKQLKYYLMLNNKSQKDLVDYLGVSQSAVSNWITGIRLPDMEIAAKIAKFLHVEVQDLIQEDRTSFVYYINDAREMAQFLYENPDYKVLFDAAKKVKREDIAFVKEFLDRFEGDDN